MKMLIISDTHSNYVALFAVAHTEHADAVLSRSRGRLREGTLWTAGFRGTCGVLGCRNIQDFGYACCLEERLRNIFIETITLEIGEQHDQLVPPCSASPKPPSSSSPPAKPLALASASRCAGNC
jgi:hypothetical protein